MPPELLDRLLLSVENGRLAALCGAGLSMSPPTRIPSATNLARVCSDGYASITTTQLSDAIRLDLERLADHCLEMNRFTDFLRLVPWNAFSHAPNPGHLAIADFLCCGALALTATTNYDTHIEDAAFQLGERSFRSALDGTEAADQPNSHRPLLKLHGCHRRDLTNTLWARSQLQQNHVIRNRVHTSQDWLTGQLAGKDLLILGFWTDWRYLNEVLSDALTRSEPRTVVLVDPADADSLQDKAPTLWVWATSGQIDFTHVRLDAAQFLDHLRASFSRAFLARVLAGGAPLLTALFPTLPATEVPLPADLTSADLYSLRKDVCGCSAAVPARTHRPEDSMYMVGAFLIAIFAAGGRIDGPLLRLGDNGMRVVNCPNRLLSTVKAEFSRELGSLRDCNVAICVGAVDDCAPGDLVRGGQPPTVLREGWTGQWLTTESAREFLAP